MKRTLAIVLSAALLALAGACTNDEEGEKSSESTMTGERGPHGKRGFRGDPAKRVERLKAKLDLSDEQAEQVKGVFAAGGTREEIHEAIKAILTPEQLTQFEEVISKRRKFGRHGKLGKRGKRAPEEKAKWLQEELGLTDEVTAKVKAVYEADNTRDEKHKALQGILSPEEYEQYLELKKNRGHWKGKKGMHGRKSPDKHAAWMQEELGLTDAQKTQLEAAFKASKSRDEMLKALQGILTPDQLAQHDKMKAERKGHFGKHGKHGEQCKDCMHCEHGKDAPPEK